MNEKPHRLDMGFGEALARLVRVPKAADIAPGGQDGKRTGQSVTRPIKPLRKSPTRR